MEHRLNNKVRKAALVVFASLIALTAGCGDGFFNKGGGMFDSVLSRQLEKRMAGADVELLEYTGCEVAESSDPEARCKGISGTQIEVFVDGKSIIFDFSNVTNGGKFSEESFEGYVLSVKEDSGAPAILQAVLDAAKSSMNPDKVDVQFDDKNVAVNFQGLDYDDTTFIKIDLQFEGAS